MKIVHIQQYFNDGMGYQENIFPRYQSKLNHEVTLITSTLNNGFNGKREVNSGVYTENGFKIKRIDIIGEFKNRFVVFKGLYKELENIKPDYIYHHGVTAPSIKTVCEYKKNNPHVFLATDNHADLNISAKNVIWKNLYYNIWWKNYLRKYNELIDLYFGVTPARCLFLNEELGIENSKIRLLPIGADTDNILVNIDKEELLEKYKINKDSFVIVHGGKITPEKQTDRIVEAFSILTDSDITLVLFGKIEDEKVKRLIKNDKRIVYLGWLNREETLEVLKHSDIGVWNTQHTTLLEDAIAVGLPMILRYYGSTSHLIDNSGLFLYDGSVREIYDKLNLVIKNKELIKEFKTNVKKMSKIISYDNIAKESIEYKDDVKPKKIHNKFMKKKYSDSDFEYFRKIRRK